VSQAWKGISNEAKIFIRRLLQVDPEKRYTAKQALEDPWIKIYTSVDNFSQPVALNALQNLGSFTVSNLIVNIVIGINKIAASSDILHD